MNSNVPSSPTPSREVFDYSGSELSRLGWSTFWMGLLFILLPAGAIVTVPLGLVPVEGGNNDPIFWFLVVLFLFIGIWVVRSGLTSIRRAENDQVIVTPTHVIWIDGSGTERTTATYSQIRHTVEETFTQLANRRDDQTRLKCTVTTDVGPIVFDDNMPDYERLRGFIMSHEKAPAKTGVYRYWLVPFC